MTVMTFLTVASRSKIRAMAAPDSFGELEAASLYCRRCGRATPARKKLLLVLPTGNKYDYVCAECGASVGGKSDNDARDFYRTIRAPGTPRKSAS